MSEIVSFEVKDEKWASELQSGLELYMDTLHETLDATMDDHEWDYQTESELPYCGCHTCEYREILSYVTPRIIKGYLAGSVGMIVNGTPVP